MTGLIDIRQYKTMTCNFDFDLLGSGGLLGVDEDVCNQNFAETCREICGSEIQLRTIDSMRKQYDCLKSFDWLQLTSC